jgi:hypothetical protein
MKQNGNRPLSEIKMYDDRETTEWHTSLAKENGCYNGMNYCQKVLARVRVMLHKLFCNHSEKYNGVMNLTSRNERSLLNFQELNENQNEEKRKETFSRNSDVKWEADGSGVVEDAAERISLACDRSYIRMFEEGLPSEYNDNTEYSERNRCEAESKRLVTIAKHNGCYITQEEVSRLGERYPKSTGESVVYLDKSLEKVYKFKDPYAKLPIKHGVKPENAIYEHIVHNLLFPETRYQFEGISDEFGDVRVVLSQMFVESYVQPTKSQIKVVLAQRGLRSEGKYSFGNEYVTITDVLGDNTLLGIDGKVYFIDPIIGFKKSVEEVIKGLSAVDAH